MKPVFQKAHAETYKDFLVLVRLGGKKITFSYVYDDPGPVNLEFDLPDVEPDEQYLAFNLAEHGDSGKRYFGALDYMEFGKGPSHKPVPAHHPIPYWTSFIGGIGNFSDAFSLDEAREMVLRSRAEMKMIWKAFEKK
jgi:hypothetical protein